MLQSPFCCGLPLRAVQKIPCCENLKFRVNALAEIFEALSQHNIFIVFHFGLPMWVRLSGLAVPLRSVE